jgi:hypothetical protein
MKCKWHLVGVQYSRTDVSNKNISVIRSSSWTIAAVGLLNVRLFILLRMEIKNELTWWDTADTAAPILLNMIPGAGFILGSIYSTVRGTHKEMRFKKIYDRTYSKKALPTTLCIAKMPATEPTLNFWISSVLKQGGVQKRCSPFGAASCKQSI